MEGQAIKDSRLDIFTYMNIWRVVIVCILRTFFVETELFEDLGVKTSPINLSAGWRVATPHIKH